MKNKEGGKAKLYANNVIVVVVEVEASLQITREWRMACGHICSSGAEEAQCFHFTFKYV